MSWGSEASKLGNCHTELSGYQLHIYNCNPNSAGRVIITYCTPKFMENSYLSLRQFPPPFPLNILETELN